MARFKPLPPLERQLTPEEQADARAQWRDLASSRARHWHRHGGGDLRDYLQAADIGLWWAAQRFDTSRGRSFGSYAQNWIDRELRLIAKSERSRGVVFPNSKNKIVAAPVRYFSEVEAGWGDDSGAMDPPDARLDEGQAAEFQRRRHRAIEEVRDAVARLPVRGRVIVKALYGGGYRDRPALRRLDYTADELDAAHDEVLLLLRDYLSGEASGAREDSLGWRLLQRPRPRPGPRYGGRKRSFFPGAVVSGHRLIGLADLDDKREPCFAVWRYQCRCGHESKARGVMLRRPGFGCEVCCPRPPRRRRADQATVSRRTPDHDDGAAAATTVGGATLS
ncbi:hypothetical protein J0H58_21685 [bacterium]|nr:hypothetical protein [bacterium]